MLHGKKLDVHKKLGPKSDCVMTFAGADACRELVMVCLCFSHDEDTCMCTTTTDDQVRISPSLLSAGMARGACSRMALLLGWHFCMHTTSSTLTSAPGAPRHHLPYSKHHSALESLPATFARHSSISQHASGGLLQMHVASLFVS